MEIDVKFSCLLCILMYSGLGIVFHQHKTVAQFLIIMILINIMILLVLILFDKYNVFNLNFMERKIK
jgi:hypothetical protein